MRHSKTKLFFMKRKVMLVELQYMIGLEKLKKRAASEI